MKLSGSNLVFYKNQLAAKPQPGSPHGRPDFIVPLLGAQVEKNTGEKSSKKNVISVSHRSKVRVCSKINGKIPVKMSFV